MAKLAGKISAVTGAAQGIGREIALLFAREGADVAIVDRNKKSGEDVAEQIRSLGRRSISIVADIGEEDQIEEGFRNILRELGPVDILVNNAGIDTTSLVVDMPTSLWDEMFRINLRSVFLCTRAVLPGMIEKRSGRIINLASQLAYKGGREMAHYAAAKAGVIGFTRSLAYEVAEHGITVNAIYRTFPQTSRGMAQAKARGTSDRPSGQGGGNSAHSIAPCIRGWRLLPRRYLKSKRRGRDGLKDSRWYSGHLQEVQTLTISENEPEPTDRYCRHWWYDFIALRSIPGPVRCFSTSRKDRRFASGPNGIASS